MAKARRKKVEPESPAPEPEQVETQETQETQEIQEVKKEVGELVLCAKTSELWKWIPYFEGWSKIESDLSHLNDICSWVPRDEAETDPGFKQIIPYILLVQDPINHNPASSGILTYSRTSTSGEERLQGKKSCGFGGHVNPVDSDSDLWKGGTPDAEEEFSAIDAINACVSRELQEELGLSLQDVRDQVAVCWINDDSTEVGSVHLGLGILAFLPSSFKTEFKVESTIADLNWQKLTTVARQQLDAGEEWESWSPLVVSAFCNSLSQV